VERPARGWDGSFWGMSGMKRRRREGVRALARNLVSPQGAGTGAVYEMQRKRSQVTKPSGVRPSQRPVFPYRRQGRGERSPTAGKAARI